MRDNNLKRKKNVIFIISDDQGAWALGCAGNNEIKTPNLDRLAYNGVRFDNFFCVSPVCSPARASILTGNIPSAHGVVDWLEGGNIDASKHPAIANDRTFSNETSTINYLENQLTYTDILAENGYTCALTGKWHLGNSVESQHGFSKWHTVARGHAPYYKTDIIENGEVTLGDRYITDIITDKAIDYIKEFASKTKNGEEPFYISVHYTAPHSPWMKSQHPKEFFDMYEGCEFETIPNLPKHPNLILTSESPYVSFDPNNQNSDPDVLRKELLSGYFGSITAMDAGIGQIISELESQGILDDTVIIFTSDNGMNVGHHGIWGKGNGTYPQNMYDTSVKVPFIISCPSLIGTETVKYDLVSHYDIFPTLVDLLGLQLDIDQKATIDKLPGTSFYSQLNKDEEFDEDKEIVVYSEYGPVRMIRNKRWKYIHCYPHGPNEFYDLENDLEESINLINDEKYQDIVNKMKWNLDLWFLKYVDPARDATKDDVTGNGQIYLNGVYSKGKKSFVNSPFIGMPYDNVCKMIRDQIVNSMNNKDK
jgi:arylsulfatase A-like enzyme